jgi:hypothetical protein
MTLKRSLLAVLLTVFSLGHGWGQATDAGGHIISPIVFQTPDAITTSLVDAPSVGRSESGGGQNPQWLKIEFRYTVAPKDPLPFLDSVEFHIFVEGRDLYDPEAKTAEGVAVALTGTVTYVNLTATRDGYGVFYIHPSALARYSTKEGSSDFDRKFNIHLEAYVDGKKVDNIDKKKEQDLDWFKPLKAITGMVYRQDQCIFMDNDPMKCPQIKAGAPAQ